MSHLSSDDMYVDSDMWWLVLVEAPLVSCHFGSQGCNFERTTGGHGPRSGDLDWGTYRCRGDLASASGVPRFRVIHLPVRGLSRVVLLHP